LFTGPSRFKLEIFWNAILLDFTLQYTILFDTQCRSDASKEAYDTMQRRPCRYIRSEDMRARPPTTKQVLSLLCQILRALWPGSEGWCESEGNDQRNLMLFGSSQPPLPGADGLRFSEVYDQPAK
jgi:hypothetical protein